MRSWTSDRNKELILLFLASFLFIFGCVWVYKFIIDDAYISLRYARNLVNYGALSFNPGDAPIEGYTNFLLVLLEALFIKMGVQAVDNIPKVIGIISGLGSLVFTYRLSCVLIPTEGLSLRFLPVFAASVSSPLIVWAVGGLETNLYLLFILSGVYYFVSNIQTGSNKSALLSDISFFLALLCRPDALLLWALGYIYLLLMYRRVNWTGRIYSIVMSLVLTAAYFSWKLFYFDDLLPTTFRAKVAPFSLVTIEGGLRMYRLFAQYGLHLVYLFLLGIAAWKLRKNLFSGLTYIFVLFCGYSVFLIYIGAPAMGHGLRFFVPIIPLLYIMGTYGLTQLKIVNSDIKLKVCVIAILYLVQLGAGFYWLERYWNTDFDWPKGNTEVGMKEEAQMIESNRALGRWAKEVLVPGSTVALSDIGAIGYFSDLRIIDTWSIMDRRIIELRAEQVKYASSSKEYEKVNNQIAEYVLELKPDLIRLDFVDFSQSPRAQGFVLIDNPVDKKRQMFFARRDLLGAITPNDLMLNSVKYIYVR